MTQTLSHRGPDDSGVWLSERPSPWTKGSALLTFLQSVSRGVRFSRLRFATVAACQVAGLPVLIWPVCWPTGAFTSK
jgi:asparagine synthetase B (glutamine-hydrolysing)